MPSFTRRRALQTGSAVLLGGLAGCADRFETEPPVIDRFVFRSDTGENEPIAIRMAHAPRDGSTRQTFAVFEAHGSGQVRIVDLDDGPGFYSVYAEAQNRDTTAFPAFNSHKGGALDGDLQFEFVVTESGSLYSNTGASGDEISMPGDEA